jgi:hypothetical protein
MALSMATSAFAADTSPTAAPQQTAKPAAREAKIGSHIVAPTDLGTVKVWSATIGAPGDAQWTDDDSSAPELPMAREQDAGKP